MLYVVSFGASDTGREGEWNKTGGTEEGTKGSKGEREVGRGEECESV